MLPPAYDDEIIALLAERSLKITRLFSGTFIAEKFIPRFSAAGRQGLLVKGESQYRRWK